MSGSAERARGLLGRPGAWIEAQGAAYVVRLGPDRRARVNLTIGEAAFLALIETPGLVARDKGGWEARAPVEARPSPAPGRPGQIEGTQAVMEADGQLTLRRANLGESPIAWLARRKDQSGRPWLSAAEVAAGERLRTDARDRPGGTVADDAVGRAAALGHRVGGAGGAGRPGAVGGGAGGGGAAGGGAAVAAVPGTDLHRGERTADGGARTGLRKRQGKTLLKQGLQRWRSITASADAPAGNAAGLGPLVGCVR